MVSCEVSVLADFDAAQAPQVAMCWALRMAHALSADGILMANGGCQRGILTANSKPNTSKGCTSMSALNWFSTFV